jgi:hypothetical protein
VFVTTKLHPAADDPVAALEDLGHPLIAEAAARV